MLIQKAATRPLLMLGECKCLWLKQIFTYKTALGAQVVAMTPGAMHAQAGLEAAAAARAAASTARQQASDARQQAQATVQQVQAIRDAIRAAHPGH